MVEIMGGQMLSGRYRLQSVLGRGGMATVWRGTDERLARPVAVKVLDRSATTEPHAVRRFDQEARTAGRLTHPHIVAVHDVGVDNDLPYLVMELVEGLSLAALLDRGPLPVDQAARIAAQVCDALAAAHAHGVVHRDIKPANILLTSSGVAKVCDFGIARLMSQQQAGLTAPHTVIGTSSYMAPEQAIGAAVDARTDLYALGCVLYAMLTGEPPYVADNPLAVMWQHQHEPAPSVRSVRADVPVGLDDLIRSLLAKDPVDRPAAALEARSRLAAPSQDTSVRATPPAMPRTRTMPVLEPTTVAPATALRRVRSRPAAIVAVAVVVSVVLASLITAALVSSHSDERPSASTPVRAATSLTTVSPPATSSTLDASDPTTAIRSVIDQQRRTGHLDARAAQELSAKLREVVKELTDGDTDEAADKLDDLRDTLEELRRDGDITPAAQEAIQVHLGRLAATPPADEHKKKKKH